MKKPGSMPSLRLILVLAGGLILFIAVLNTSLYFLYDRGWIAFNNPDRKRFPVRGLDISHHQGTIDWKKVSADGFRFVFIKATEGGDFVDPRFAQNWKESNESGLLRGAYHFFTLCRPGPEQARNFIRTVPAEKGMLPPVIDLEFGGNCSRRPNREEIRAELRSFSQMLRARYGREPFFYTTREFFESYGEAFWTDRLWIRDIFFEPDGAFVHWIFWQFTARGRVPGIRGPVDVNVFRFTELELQALTAD